MGDGSGAEHDPLPGECNPSSVTVQKLWLGCLFELFLIFPDQSTRKTDTYLIVPGSISDGYDGSPFRFPATVVQKTPKGPVMRIILIIPPIKMVRFLKANFASRRGLSFADSQEFKK